MDYDELKEVTELALDAAYKDWTEIRSDSRANHDAELCARLFNYLTNAIEKAKTKDKFGFHSEFILGARVACKKMHDWWNDMPKRKEERIYREAEFRLFTESVDGMHRFIYSTGDMDIGYRNHVRDKKGNLVSVEAYFIK